MHSFLPCDPELIADRIDAAGRRVLLVGPSGFGKSTLSAELARIFDRNSRSCSCIGADPGSPDFGVPGAVCSGKWQRDYWQPLHFEALCTLDAGRFRLPLVAAVRRLAAMDNKGIVLVDAPGVVRGIAGAELFIGLVDAAAIDVVVALAPKPAAFPLANELAAPGCKVFYVQPSPEAHPPGLQKRAFRRTRLWEAYLGDAGERIIDLAGLPLTGTPPPREAKEQWPGRQVAILKAGHSPVMGEVIQADKKEVLVRMPDFPEPPDQLLVRDASRNRQGLLATAKPVSGLARVSLPPDVVSRTKSGRLTGRRPVGHTGEFTATLVNGIFGDPLLHLRLHNRKRSILFDLGEGGRLPAKIAHQVTDVFISHCHIDHISGFLWLMRSRIGDFPACRLFGPPGLADHVSGMINGIEWDRVGDWSPRFTIGEMHGDRLISYALQAGETDPDKLSISEIGGGILLDDPAVKVRAVTLDHGKIPVLAYSIEQPPKLNVDKERLAARNLATGPWLAKLKRLIGEGKREGILQMPDGKTITAGKAADDFILTTPSRKLAYATDLADTPANRVKLIKLARKASIFFCEAAFSEGDKENADRSGHLTARACGEIAKAADVENLVPFHLSRRYEKDRGKIYEEVKASCLDIFAAPTKKSS